MREIKVKSNPYVHIDVSCNLNLYTSDSNSIFVEVVGKEDEFKFETNSKNYDLNIRQLNKSSGGISIVNGNMNFGNISQISVGSGTSIITSGGSTYITGGSGKVFVNGKQVNISDYTDEHSDNLLELNVYLPSCDLDLEISGVAQIQSSVKNIDRLNISCEGTSVISDISCNHLDINASGASEIVKAIVTGGELNVSSSGSSEIQLHGEYSRVSVTSSGSSEVTTYGDCTGDYRAVGSGSSSIRHRGVVDGRVRESKSGCATISI